MTLAWMPLVQTGCSGALNFNNQFHWKLSQKELILLKRYIDIHQNAISSYITAFRWLCWWWINTNYYLKQCSYNLFSYRKIIRPSQKLSMGVRRSTSLIIMWHVWIACPYPATYFLKKNPLFVYKKRNIRAFNRYHSCPFWHLSQMAILICV